MTIQENIFQFYYTKRQGNRISEGVIENNRAYKVSTEQSKILLQ
jgi:hypothetical protein